MSASTTSFVAVPSDPTQAELNTKRQALIDQFAAQVAEGAFDNADLDADVAVFAMITCP